VAQQGEPSKLRIRKVTFVIIMRGRGTATSTGTLNLTCKLHTQVDTKDVQPDANREHHMRRRVVIQRQRNASNQGVAQNRSVEVEGDHFLNHNEPRGPASATRHLSQEARVATILKLFGESHKK
jgi:hypothetical protein